VDSLPNFFPVPQILFRKEIIHVLFSSSRKLQSSRP
jgi:hypothetical protein